VIIVVTHKGQENAFIDLLSNLDVKFEQRRTKHIFYVHDIDKENPILSHSCVKDFQENVEFNPEDFLMGAQQIDIDKSQFAKFMRMQPVSPPLKTSPWQIADAIRRVSPWTNSNNRKASSTFKCKRTGEGVDIYVFDTGMSCDDEEFEDRAFDVDGLRYPEKLMTRWWGGFHGSMVAAGAAGKVHGIAKKATLWNKLALYSGGRTAAFLFEQMEKVHAHIDSRISLNRPAIVNMSLGGPPMPQLKAEMEEMLDKGVIFVAAAGNLSITLSDSGFGAVTFEPASYAFDGFITVGATNLERNIAFFSNYNHPRRMIYAGGEVASGKTMTSYLPDAPLKDTFISGTSFASPLVAGILACMLQGHNRPTNRAEAEAAIQALLKNATKNVINPRVKGRQLGYGPVEIEMTEGQNLLAYLDPNIEFELIEGLTKKV